MALTKTKKVAVIDQVEQLLAGSKLTVVADYRGLTVAQAQDLRRQASQNGSQVMVIKNRLVKQALARRPKLASMPTDNLAGMLVYVFNNDDEIAPAQAVKSFRDQTKATIEIVGAISSQGEFLAREEVVRYASLPGREQALFGILAALKSPWQRTIGALQSPAQKIVGSLKSKKS